MNAGYIALIGNARPETRSLLRHCPGYIVSLDHPELLVVCRADTDRLSLADGQGLILGTLFDAGSLAPEPVEQFDDQASKAAIESCGRTLVAQFWGSYVAFLVQRNGQIAVVRDPSGGTACYWSRTAAAVLLTSNIRACASLGLVAREIDWDAVCAHLLWPERRNARTCLASVRELMPGCRLTVKSGMVRDDRIWQPWQFTSLATSITSQNEAADAVCAAVSQTVAAWCRRYPRPLVSLSGGLDSSILMASTTSAAGAVTFVTHEALGDERGYARAVAERCSVKLLERCLSDEAIQPKRSNAAALPRPVARLFGQELDRLWRDTVAETSADALFHGGGGDNVFCYLASGTPYLDGVIAGLPAAQRRAVCESLSEMTRVSTWRIQRAALRKLILDRGRYRWFRNQRMLSADAIRLGKPMEPHPWFEAIPSRTLPGKQAHVAALIRIQNYLEAIEPRQKVPVVAPLMSQPVIEACLRVPTWLWCRDGMNRMVARDAFRESLPASVIGRRSKGSPAAFDAQLVAARRGELFTLLNDGHLARRGLINMAAVGDALGKSGPLRGDGYLRVTELVDVEAWLQSWVGAPSGPRSQR